MTDLFDFKKIRNNHSDVVELQVVLSQLVGQPFQFFRLSYGDEVNLHLGELQDYDSPCMQHLKKGSYIIAFRLSSWIISPSLQYNLITSSNLPKNLVDIREIESGNFIAPGSIVTDAIIQPSSSGDTFSLQLSFLDGSHVGVYPNPKIHPNPSEDEISDWEVFTPHERVLIVGPGSKWSYLNSVEKASD